MLPPNIILFTITIKLFSHIMPSKLYLGLLYRLRFKRKMNWSDPKTYNEKLQHMKINCRDDTMTQDVDKYAVREKVSDRVGAAILIPIIAVYNTVDEIDFTELPDQFVLKCTHGTHCSIICKDKSHFDVESARKKIKSWMNHNYYYDSREWPYKNVKPRILIEKYIKDAAGELIDYKFMCFDGKVKLILVHQDINNEKGKHTLDLYTPDWELTDIEWGIPRSGKPIPKPELLDECIRISEILSKGKPHVRVDLYIVDNKVLFGELTYYTAAGLKPFRNYEDDLMLGGWINIEKVKP